MIIKKKADKIADAAYSVTLKMLEHVLPPEPVVIKPNLVEPSPPPITTDVRVVEGIIKALRKSGITEILVAEGSGTGDTNRNFNILGYSKLDAGLIDLDKEGTISLPVDRYNVWEEIIVPEILLDKFIISAPVLKEHSMCGVTLSLKNMVGILPAQYYSGYWTFKKSLIHKYNEDGCIADIISVIKPDWAVVDASIGMRGSHLSGTPIEPPINLIYGSSDPLEADKFGCELLGRNWQRIKYLSIIEGKKGQVARSQHQRNE